MSFDAIVLGCGGVGSAWVSVAGIDQVAPPHVHGSSHGHSRAIRKAYFEYVGPQNLKLLQFFTSSVIVNITSAWRRDW